LNIVLFTVHVALTLLRTDGIFKNMFINVVLTRSRYASLYWH